MPGISVDVRDVVRADDVALRPRVIALARVGNGVAAGIQNAVSPVRAAAQAAADDPAVYGALRLARFDRREHFQIRIVEQIGAFLEPRDLAFGLDPTHLVHHGRAVDHRELRQLALDFLPVRGADIVLLEADALAPEPEAFQHLSELAVRRFGVGLVHLDALRPRVAPREAFGDLVEHDHRLTVAWPDHNDAAHRIGDVEMPRERSRIREARQVREVLSRARDDGRQPVAVHVLMQARDVRDDLGLRLGHGSPLRHPEPRRANVAGGHYSRGDSWGTLWAASSWSVGRRRSCGNAAARPPAHVAGRRPPYASLGAERLSANSLLARASTTRFQFASAVSVSSPSGRGSSSKLP